MLEFSLAENIALHDYAEPPDSKWGWLFPGRLVERAKRLIEEFDVRGGGPFTLAGALSGGNQQKLVAAREISRDPKALIAAQPTRGLDVGAIEYLHRRLVTERDEGRAILLVSLELDEIFSLSDRILVLYEGEIVGEPRGRRVGGADRLRDGRCEARGPRRERAQEGSEHPARRGGVERNPRRPALAQSARRRHRACRSRRLSSPS